jgi:hypothetical protein
MTVAMLIMAMISAVMINKTMATSAGARGHWYDVPT